MVVSRPTKTGLKFRLWLVFSLLPPYDPAITEKQWKAYHECVGLRYILPVLDIFSSERSALDKANTCGYNARPTLKPDELCVNPWRVLEDASKNIAAAIYGSVLEEEEKVAIARTLRGSLYFLEIEGEVDE